MTTRERILALRDDIGLGQPFTNEMIRNALPGTPQGNVAKALHDMRAAGDCERIARGLWYFPGRLPNGTKVPENYAAVARLLWLGDNGCRFGYVAGAGYAAAIGLQTILPARKDIYTNEHLRHKQLAKRYLINLHKPRVPVCEGNWRELRLLDCLLEQRMFDCADPQKIILHQIRRQNLNAELLRELCDEHYPKHVRNLVRGLTYVA